MESVPSDIEVSYGCIPKSMREIAEIAGIDDSEVIPWGLHKAKVSLSVRDRLKDTKNGNYIVVTAINPTPLGEGKSTATVGLT